MRGAVCACIRRRPQCGFSFPVDLIRDNGRYRPGMIERSIGVHSDVGGGYAANEQGVSDSYAYPAQ